MGNRQNSDIVRKNSSDEIVPSRRRPMRMLTFLLAGLTLFAANAMGQLSPAAPDRYDPDWTSLKRHPVPKWFEDAKLGIFVHWDSIPCLRGP